MPVASFAPEMLALYTKAAQEPVRVEGLTRKQAFNLRYRMHNLRKAMRREEHHLLPFAEGVTLSIEGPAPTSDAPDPPAILTARPADHTFLSAIRRAGVEVEDASASALDPTPDSATALAKFLAEGPLAPPTEDSE